MRSTENLFSMVSSKLSYWRRNSSWILSSDTPLGAKVVKGVISWGVLEVLMVAKVLSTTNGGCEVTSISGGLITSSWGLRCAWSCWTIFQIQVSLAIVYLQLLFVFPSTGNSICLVFVEAQSSFLDLEPKDADQESMDTPWAWETLPVVMMAPLIASLEYRERRRGVSWICIDRTHYLLLSLKSTFLVVEAIYIGQTEDLHHMHVVGVVFLVIIKDGSKARVLIHVFIVKEHGITLIKLNAWL